MLSGFRLKNIVVFKVERTRTRPLASGELSERDAVALLTILLSASLGILLQFNWFR